MRLVNILAVTLSIVFPALCQTLVPRYAWTVETADPYKARRLDLVYGETVDLECRFLAYTRPMELAGASVVLHGRTNGMAEGSSFQVAGAASSNGLATVRLPVDAWIPQGLTNFLWTLEVTQTNAARLLRSGGTVSLTVSSSASTNAPVPTLWLSDIRAEIAAAVAGLVTTQALSEAYVAKTGSVLSAGAELRTAGYDGVNGEGWEVYPLGFTGQASGMFWSLGVDGLTFQTNTLTDWSQLNTADGLIIARGPDQARLSSSSLKFLDGSHTSEWSFLRMETDGHFEVAAMSDLSNMATTQQLAVAVSQLASTQQLASAVAPFASTQQLASAVAPFASTQQLASAVAPLATTQQVSDAISAIPAPDLSAKLDVVGGFATNMTSRGWLALPQSQATNLVLRLVCSNEHIIVQEVYQ